MKANVRWNFIRYAQVWEDAEVLCAGLNTAQGGRILSVCSGGDNALALLTLAPRELLALDLSEVQTFCLHLRVAAIQTLSRSEVITFLGVHAEDISETHRLALYQRVRTALPAKAQDFWDNNSKQVARGVIHMGKFERYFALFRRFVLPFILSKHDVDHVLSYHPPSKRAIFFQQHLNHPFFRSCIRLFFSPWLMGKLGRDPAFFRFTQGHLAENILKRTQYALVTLDPSQNPYLHYILRGEYQSVLPYWLRPEPYALVQKHLSALRIEVASLDQLDAITSSNLSEPFDAMNLSDVFEYLSPADANQLLTYLAQRCHVGGRLLYWNMLTPRDGQDVPILRPLTELSNHLYSQDKAFFYSRLIVEERC